MNLFIDAMFLIDIFLSFASAYYTEEYELVENRIQIAKNYVCTWFLIDLLAIFPFEILVPDTDENDLSVRVNDMAKLARLTRLSKIIRLLRMFRILQLGKLLR